MEETILPTSFTLQVDNGNITYLSEAARWAKFIAVIGFIVCAILIIIGLLAGTFFTSTSFQEIDPELKSMGSLGSVFFAIIFIVTALLYFFPSLYLFNFASKMQVALRNNDQINLNASFRNLKSCLKFFGVMLVIGLCIYAIAIIFSVIAGISLNH